MSQNMLPFQLREARRYGWSLKTLKLLLLRLVQTRTFRSADRVIFLTQYARTAVLKVTGELLGEEDVIPFGISSRFFSPPRRQRQANDFTQDRPCRVQYVSVIDLYKHQWQVAEAVAQLRSAGVPVVLDLIGPRGPGMDRLESTLRRVDPERVFVNLRGAIPYEQVHEVYPVADIGVFASSCENMPFILLESMAAGLPLACSRRGPMPEMLGEAGVYFDPEDPKEIAAALRQLIESSDLRAEKAAAAYRRAREWSWDRCAEATFSFLGLAAKAHRQSGGVSRRWARRAMRPAKGVLLDAWRNPATDIRVAVDGWWAMEPILDQFIVRPRSPRMVFSYAQRLGSIAVWRKIRSRLAEAQRNVKVAGIGVGRVCEAPHGSGLRLGDSVVFFAPNHSPRWPRITLDRRLVRQAHWREGSPAQPFVGLALELLRQFVGWSPYSGAALDDAVVGGALDRLALACATTGGAGAPRPVPPREAQERLERETRARKPSRPTAVLFGLGNYAKTQILPHIRRHLALEAVHEIDPDQIAAAARLGVTLDTSPQARSHERYDAWFIAGFHDSHAALAARALESGAYAVVEKPLAASGDQFERVRQAMSGAAARRLFVCFQKRYSRLHEWAREDLAVERGGPVDMHCIVYEIPLPRRHWYNWPNSGSRLVSNGCHWLDYFLFVNDFTTVAEYFVRPMRGSDLLAFVRLDNGAQLTMSLTDCGSERLGTGDVVELRAGRVTVRLTDAAYYTAESSQRVLRKARVNPMEAYRRMYDVICRRIAAAEAGDSVESLRSTSLMLDLEDALRSSTRRT
jgi:predicted dehydrogenase